MDLKGLKRFLAALGITDAEPSGEWLRLRCPFAKWAHQNGDSNPSFGILINPDGPSLYYCFGCQPQAQPLGRLIFTLWQRTGVYPVEAAKILAGHPGDFKRTLITAGDQDEAYNEEDPEFQPIPREIRKAYPLLSKSSSFEAKRCREYLINDRGISAQTLALFKVRYSAARQSLVFPFTDVFGKIFSFRVRSRKSKTIYSVNAEIAKEDSDFEGYKFVSRRDVGYWFGLHLIDWEEPVILVESEIDALRLFELGETNVIAAGGTGVTRRQLRALTAVQVILGFDADKGGKAANERVRDMLMDDEVPTYLMDWSLARKANGEPCKDAGDLPNRDALNLVRSKRRRY